MAWMSDIYCSPYGPGFLVFLKTGWRRRNVESGVINHSAIFPPVRDQDNKIPYIPEWLKWLQRQIVDLRHL